MSIQRYNYNRTTQDYLQRIEFTRQTNALVKTNEKTIELLLLITKTKTSPLMGLDWMQRLKINLSSNNEAIRIHNIKLGNMDKKIMKLQNVFKDLIYNNKEIKNLSVKEQLKEGAQIIQQKRRPIPIHTQDQVALELKRLIKHGYLERATEMTEDCFVSPAVITVKKDKLLKIALDSRKLNEVTIKRKTQMPNMEELISGKSRKISEGKEGEILATKLDFDYAYGQIKLDENTKTSVFHRNRRGLYWILSFLEKILRTGQYTNNFSRRVDTTIEHKHQARLDDIIIVTKGIIDEHEMELRETMKKLEQDGYRLNPKKCEFFKKNRMGWTQNRPTGYTATTR